MKSNIGRFSILNRRAEYLKLKEKEKKKEENVEELEEDEEEDKNNKNIQKPKNIPITKTPLIPNTSLNRLDKQKLLSNSTSYNFTKSRINYASNNNNTKDLLIMRQGQEKKLQIMGTKSSNDITNNSKQNKQNSTYQIKTSINSPKNIKINNNNNPPQISKENSMSNLNKEKIHFYGNKYSNIRKFGDISNKEPENKNEIKIINKNNNFTINVTNNNNTFTLNNNNFINDNNKFINISSKQEKEINNEINISPKKEPTKEKEEQNIIVNSFKNIEEKIEKDNDINVNNNEEKNDEIKEERKEEKKIEKEGNIDNNKRPEYVSNEKMIENGIEIVKFSEEETNNVYKQKEEREKKKNKKKQKKEKYKNKNKDNNDNNKTDKKENNNYYKKDHYYNRSYYNYKNEYIYDNDYDDDIFYNNRRGGYKHFYERGRPNPIFRGRRGKFRY